MSDLEDKISNGRLKDKENERIKLDCYKTYLATINSYTKLAKDTKTEYSRDDVLTLLGKHKGL